ncbi:MAG: glycosyltransferase family 1 protein [Bacteroidaceae bacterium]
MKIAIEAQRIFREKKHGMDMVVLETIRELQNLDMQNEYFVLVSPGKDRCLEETPNFHIIEVTTPSYPLWEQYGLLHAVNRIKPDVLHCTSNTAPLFCKIPLVLTLHDIIFLEPREGSAGSLYQNLGWYYRKCIVPRILKKCSKIITVSQFECRRIQEKLHLSADRIMYIYNGFSSHFHPVPDFLPIVHRYLDSDHFFFFLGNTDPKKNTARTLKAYALYARRVGLEQALPLLVADLDKDHLEAHIKAEELDDVAKLIHVSGYIANKDLPAVFTAARAFVYTSLRESFGIPLLEAMACGTPVLTSNTSSMPEIGGDGALLVDPFNEWDMAFLLESLATDDLLCERLRKQGFENIKRFSWKHTAECVLEVYKEVYHQTTSKDDRN